MRPLILLTATALAVTQPEAIRAQAVPRRAGPTLCAGLASADTTTYEEDEVTERPRLRSEPPPPERLQHHINGTAVFSAIVEPSGTVDSESVRIVQSLDTVNDRAVERWVRRWSYWPGCLGGRPVRVHITRPAVFRVP